MSKNALVPTLRFHLDTTTLLVNTDWENYQFHSVYAQDKNMLTQGKQAYDLILWTKRFKDFKNAFDNTLYVIPDEQIDIIKAFKNVLDKKCEEIHKNPYKFKERQNLFDGRKLTSWNHRRSGFPINTIKEHFSEAEYEFLEKRKFLTIEDRPYNYGGGRTAPQTLYIDFVGIRAFLDAPVEKYQKLMNQLDTWEFIKHRFIDFHKQEFTLCWDIPYTSYYRGGTHLTNLIAERHKNIVYIADTPERFNKQFQVGAGEPVGREIKKSRKRLKLYKQITIEYAVVNRALLSYLEQKYAQNDIDLSELSDFFHEKKNDMDWDEYVDKKANELANTDYSGLIDDWNDKYEEKRKQYLRDLGLEVD